MRLVPFCVQRQVLSQGADSDCQFTKSDRCISGWRVHSHRLPQVQHLRRQLSRGVLSQFYRQRNPKNNFQNQKNLPEAWSIMNGSKFFKTCTCAEKKKKKLFASAFKQDYFNIWVSIRCTDSIWFAREWTVEVYCFFSLKNSMIPRPLWFIPWTKGSILRSTFFVLFQEAYAPLGTRQSSGICRSGFCQTEIFTHIFGQLLV